MRVAPAVGTFAVRFALAAVGMAVAGFAGIAAARSSTTGSIDRCTTRGKTIVENSHVRIYARRRGASGDGEGLYGCHRRSGATQQLDLPNGGVTAYRPPGLSLSGSVVGFATDDAMSDEPPETGVEAIDLAKGNAPWEIQRKHRVFTSAEYRFYSRWAAPVTVGSLRVKRNLSLAWIVCPGDEDLDGSPEPDCVRPHGQQPNAVLTLERNSKRKVLVDYGRGIDPSSLRISGSMISWTKNGRRRRADLR